MDFRYHLISIIAVLLALVLGILVGSGFIGGPLLADIEKRVKQVQEENDDLLKQIDVLERQVDLADDFGNAVEPVVTDGALNDRALVVLSFAGADGGAIQSIVDRAEAAGATATTTITFTEEWTLASLAKREELALVLRSTLQDPGELIAEAGRMLGVRVGEAAAQRDRASPGVQQRLTVFIEELDESGFVTVNTSAEENLVPPGASFLILGGGEDELRWSAATLITSLGNELASRNVAALVGETSRSQWDLVQQLRDSTVAAAISTVDHADTPEGRIAVVLGLDRMQFGIVGHYGTSSGASSLLPGPAAGSEL